jgi:hypothetical protein
MPKYCDGVSPQDPAFTCRQIGAQVRQKEKNENHPIYTLYATRTNTIRKHHERGKITEELRKAALRMARAAGRSAVDNDTPRMDTKGTWSLTAFMPRRIQQ